MAHCIKVATDFLSIEAISTCATLAQEFREENRPGVDSAWKDDVLQLTALLYYAWCSLQRPFEATRHEYQATSSGPNGVERGNEQEAQQSLAGEKRDFHQLETEAGSSSKDASSGCFSKSPLEETRVAKAHRPQLCRTFRCRHCNSDKQFFDHGIKSHL